MPRSCTHTTWHISKPRSGAPSLLWVMTGARNRDRISADIRQLRRQRIEIVDASAEGIDAPAQWVVTSQGQLGYDRLVIALGAELAPEALPGFAEEAHNLYTSDGAKAAHKSLCGIDRRRVATVVSRLPYKWGALRLPSA